MMRLSSVAPYESDRLCVCSFLWFICFSTWSATIKLILIGLFLIRNLYHFDTVMNSINITRVSFRGGICPTLDLVCPPLEMT